MSPSRSRSSRSWMVGAAVLSLIVTATAAPASAREDAVSSFSATPLTPDGSGGGGAKSASGRLAQSDADLLSRSDAAVTPVMVKVDVDPVASYAGGVEGYAATSPDVTGIPIADGSPAITAYTAFVAEKVASAEAEASALIPSARMLSTYVTVYGGFAMMIPANGAKAIAELSSVAAVQSNELRQVATGEPAPTPAVTPGVTATPAATAETPVAPEQSASGVEDSVEAAAPTSGAPAPDADSTTFIGADTVWPSLGGRDKAGEGTIIGDIDTGIWPEHPMLADNGISKPAGGPWACDFGDGSVGAAFTCDDKLIGAYAFLDTYRAAAGSPGVEAYCTPTSCSARDAEGHGTHTATTAAGSYVDSASVFGVDRGAISGVAPGASVIAYRALGPNGGFEGDLVAAIGQAVLDGVDVINYSISGSANPYDATELAFLDAFAAGITVNSSAGNSGPGASTADHGSPWTTTVAASTFDRSFTSVLTLDSSDGTEFAKEGTTITAGVSDAPVVLASSVPGYTGGELCEAPFAAGSVTGKVVLCLRGGNGRVEKGYNALQGGAEGMILANPTASDVETDNHFLPVIHLEGPNDDLLAYLEAHPDVTATWAQGEATVAQGDIMAGFSSRGPIGDFLKPDVTAPGVQILAGNTPTPLDPASGPAGELFQAIAGTSMSAPHAAGVSLLVKAAHPTWTPGQIKSALMTSSLQDVVNVDGSDAGVFDRGAGSIRADRAVAPVLTISEKAADFTASANDALHRVDLNIPSVNIDPLPGAVSTERTVTNVSGSAQFFRVAATGDSGLRITVLPAVFRLAAGESQDLTVIVDGLNAEKGWHEGQITINPVGTGVNNVVLPVAANVGDAAVALTQSCDPTTIARGATTTCTVSASNSMPVPVEATIDVASNPLLQQRSVTAPATKTRFGAKWTGTLSPALPPTVASIAPSVSPGGGYLPLRDFGIEPESMGDEGILNFDVPDFLYGSESYSRVGVVSNGYVVVGGGTTGDVLFEPNGIPNPDAPNNVLAPLWTDLNPEAAPADGGIRVGSLSDGVTSWLVVDFDRVPTWSGNAVNTFQVWIELGATEGIWYSYGASGVGDAGAAVLAGAENRDGTSGVALESLPVAGDEVQVTTEPPATGGTVSFDYTLRGLVRGDWTTWAQLKSPVLRTTPMETTKITVQ